MAFPFIQVPLHFWRINKYSVTFTSLDHPRPWGWLAPQRGRASGCSVNPGLGLSVPGLPEPSPTRQGSLCGPRPSLQPQAPLRSGCGSRAMPPSSNFPANLSAVVQTAASGRDADGISGVGHTPAIGGHPPPRISPRTVSISLALPLPAGGPRLDAYTCQLGARSVVPIAISIWTTGEALISWLPWKGG